MISKSTVSANGDEHAVDTLDFSPAAGARREPDIVIERTPSEILPAGRVFAPPALITAALLGGLFTVFMLAVQFATPALVGNDGYYHIKIAYLMRTQGLKPFFEWLPLTVLNPVEFVDHHFLYHLLLVPFTFGDLRIGAKLASALYPSLTFLIFWQLLRSQKLPFAAIWAAGLLVISEAFLYRMSMPRAQSLSLAALLLALHWLLDGKHGRLLPLAFVYVWLYNAFPLLLVVVGIYTGARWMLDRRLDLRPLVYAGLGTGLGLVINPYFPQNLVFIYRHLSPKLADPTSIRVGNEWYPYETAQLFGNAGVALLALLAGLFALGLRGQRMDLRTGTALLLTFFFGALLFQSRRFIEYFPPFALLLSAFAWSPILEGWLQPGKLPAGQRIQGQAWVQRMASRLWSRQGVLAAAAILFLVPAGWINLKASQESVQRAKVYAQYLQASIWLKAHAEPGARVFQTDWDDFPRLFYFNTEQVYTIGLDPTYMQLYDPSLYDLWSDITKGRVEHPSGVIRDRFGGQYVFTDLKHDNFIEVARADPGLAEVYEDEYALIFEVLPDDE